MAETEDDLIHAAREGSFAAFGRLAAPFERQMLALAAGIAHSRQEADDIYQDALLAAFRGIGNFRLESRFSTWLHRIVVNTALSRRYRLKRAWRQVVELRQQVGTAEQLCGDDQQPEATLLNAELTANISRAMQLLSDNERTAFVLCHQQEFRLREAAEVMNCSENSIKTYLFRARSKLKEALRPYYGRNAANQEIPGK